VTGDAPTSVVLRKGNDRTYVGYNPGPTPLNVRFSDGATLAVPARGFAHQVGKGAKR
jgi:hypothetical protein